MTHISATMSLTSAEMDLVDFETVVNELMAKLDKQAETLGIDDNAGLGSVSITIAINIDD